MKSAYNTVWWLYFLLQETPWDSQHHHRLRLVTLHYQCLDIYIIYTSSSWILCLPLKMCHIKFLTRSLQKNLAAKPPHLASGQFITLALNCGTISLTIYKETANFWIFKLVYTRGEGQILMTHSALMYEFSIGYSSHLDELYVSTSSYVFTLVVIACAYLSFYCLGLIGLWVLILALDLLKRLPPVMFHWWRTFVYTIINLTRIENVSFRQERMWTLWWRCLFWYSLSDCQWLYLSALGLTISPF